MTAYIVMRIYCFPNVGEAGIETKMCMNKLCQPNAGTVDSSEELSRTWENDFLENRMSIASQ